MSDPEVPETVLTKAAEALDDAMFRMHGLISSCNHHDEARAVLAAVLPDIAALASDADAADLADDVWTAGFEAGRRGTDRDALAAQVQRVRDRCAFWADAGDAEADIATDILTAIINDGEGEA